MVSRLFGRTKKNPTPQEPQPQVSTPVETEDEGFTILGGTPQVPRPGQGPIYPSLSGYSQPPVPSMPNGYAVANATVATPAAAAHYLDGVPFVLSSQCSMGNEQFDSVVAKLDSLAERVRNINWNATEYDFNVERSVVQDVGITDTLRRLHTSS